jgi:hypothetical protein
MNAHLFLFDCIDATFDLDLETSTDLPMGGYHTVCQRHSGGLPSGSIPS